MHLCSCPVLTPEYLRPCTGQGFLLLWDSDCQVSSHCWNNAFSIYGGKAWPLHWHKGWVRPAGDAVLRVSQVLRLRHRPAVTGKEGDIGMLMPCSRDDLSKYVRSASVLNTTEINILRGAVVSKTIAIPHSSAQDSRSPCFSKFL